MQAAKGKKINYIAQDTKSFKFLVLEILHVIVI